MSAPVELEVAVLAAGACAAVAREAIPEPGGLTTPFVCCPREVVVLTPEALAAALDRAFEAGRESASKGFLRLAPPRLNSQGD